MHFQRFFYNPDRLPKIQRMKVLVQNYFKILTLFSIYNGCNIAINKNEHEI